MRSILRGSERNVLGRDDAIYHRVKRDRIERYINKRYAVSWSCSNIRWTTNYYSAYCKLDNLIKWSGMVDISQQTKMMTRVVIT